MNLIDYQIIADAIKWYTSRGYEYIDACWMSTRQAVDITKPPGASRMDVYAGNDDGSIGHCYDSLVASGEQSFIELMILGEKNGGIGPGRYLCVTPCFRDEPVRDEWHHNWFLKVELISAWPFDVRGELRDMLHAARLFYDQYVPAETLKTDIGRDIVCDGIELGSYGLRSYENMNWIYGTGVAEPRLSQVIARVRQQPGTMISGKV